MALETSTHFASWNSNISQIMYVCKYCQSSKWRGGIDLPTFNDQVGISPQNVNTSRQVSGEKFSDKAIMYWCNINLSLLTFKELYGYRSVIEVVWLKGFRSVCSFTVLVLKLFRIRFRYIYISQYFHSIAVVYVFDTESFYD